MEENPIKTIILSEDENTKEEAEIYSDYVRMVDYDLSDGQWWEGFSHCIPTETLRKILAAL